MSEVASSLDTLIAPYVGCRREGLLPVLWEIQTAFGYISPEAVSAVSQMLHVPQAEIYGVIGFYSQFYDQPTGQTIIHVCTSPVCGTKGADAVSETLCARLRTQPGETSADGQVTVMHTTCLGLCEHAPAALISKQGGEDRSYAPVEDPDDLLGGGHREHAAIIGGEHRVLLRDEHLETLREYGDYSSLGRAVRDLTPDDVIKKIEASGLIGRGGAAFPTGLKWKFTRQAAEQPHYVVCNADESEPGTFKDRVLLETRPHLVLEGIAICGYAIGASKGYLYVRGEYPEAYRILQGALAEAEEANMLGQQIMGSGFSFEIELRRGAGAYICGEETALFEAIEGSRGTPRVKPPFPTTHGLFGKPTSINNVETLCAATGIVRHGAEWFRQYGTEKSTGTKLVSISGHVGRPGVYEIVPSLKLRSLIEDYCHGAVGTLQAILMGGASGTFLTPDEIDVALTFEDLRAIDSTFGSGAIMVFNKDVDLRDTMRRLGRFFQHESCGKCFPCQLGTQRQLEILQRIDNALPGDRQRLEDIGVTMSESSLCGLGQTAASAVLSAMKKWPELF